ncbi:MULTISPECIES: hypothetical protein [Cohnella]|uniref:Uncharacterized protein n=1 Tax=Cohnella phaseoli TaxID=456490 RepID=A0A3D9KGE1_9BACL|nr:hypothetical protein [Cohnella phaseoli]RED85429.1 hypothetical protein DFP98_104134 [Cohnella phaseoli]
MSEQEKGQLSESELESVAGGGLIKGITKGIKKGANDLVDKGKKGANNAIDKGTGAANDAIDTVY